jgi:hypothetical protein
MMYVPEQPTPEQRERVRKSGLYDHGDVRLVWVLEADLCPPLPRAPCWQCGGAGTYTTLIGEATATLRCEACQ